MDRILKTEFKPAIPFLTTPSILLHYRENSGEMRIVTIRFPGFTAKLAGFDPEAIYRLIMMQLERSAANKNL
jgi:O-acetyl-ADP-ribose deacetylase (regulator of RNase III)